MRVTVRLFCYLVIVGLPVNSWTNPSLSNQSAVANTATPRPSYSVAPTNNQTIATQNSALKSSKATAVAQQPTSETPSPTSSKQ